MITLRLLHTYTPESFCEGRVVANQGSGQLVKCWHEAQARISHVLQGAQAYSLPSPPLGHHGYIKRKVLPLVYIPVITAGL